MSSVFSGQYSVAHNYTSLILCPLLPCLDVPAKMFTTLNSKTDARVSDRRLEW